MLCRAARRPCLRTLLCVHCGRCSTCRRPNSKDEWHSVLDRQITNVNLSPIFSYFFFHSFYPASLSLPSREVLEHPKFHELCVKMNRVARHLSENEVVDAIKMLQFLGVESNSKIQLILLNLLRHHINELTLEHITFLDFVLGKMKAIPIVEALQMALPMVFQMRATEMDYENVPRLLDYFNYASNHIRAMNEKTINILMTAVMLHAPELTAPDAKRIVWAFSRWHRIAPQHQQLLAICIDRLAAAVTELRTTDLELLVTKFAIKCRDQDEFYSEPFLRLVTEELIKRDLPFQNAVLLLRDFLQMVSEFNVVGGDQQRAFARIRFGLIDSGT